MKRPEHQIQRLSDFVASFSTKFGPINGHARDLADAIRWVAELEAVRSKTDAQVGVLVNERNAASRERDRAVRALARCRGELEACRQVIQDVLDDEFREPSAWLVEAAGEVLSGIVETMHETSAETLGLDHLSILLLEGEDGA